MILNNNAKNIESKKKRKERKEKKREEKNTIVWLFLDLKYHKLPQFDHINLQHSNSKFLLILMNYKNLSKLLDHSNPFLLLFIYFLARIAMKNSEKKNHFDNWFQYKGKNIDMNNFHLISLNIYHHLSIDSMGNSFLFMFIIYLFSFSSRKEKKRVERKNYGIQKKHWNNHLIK